MSWNEVVGLKIGKHAVFLLRRKLFLRTCNFHKAKHTIAEPARLMTPNIRILEKTMGLVKSITKCLGIN